jgi:hypothetical protein
MPLQPAFSAFLGTTDADVTGDGAQYTLGSANALTEIFDQGSDFTTAGVFTAPATGRYFLAAGFLMEEASTATDSEFLIVTSNRTWYGSQMDVSGIDVSGDWGINYSILTDMDASDVADTRMTLTGVGADSCDVHGGATDPLSWFCGYLEV